MTPVMTMKDCTQGKSKEGTHQDVWTLVIYPMLLEQSHLGQSQIKRPTKQKKRNQTNVLTTNQKPVNRMGQKTLGFGKDERHCPKTSSRKNTLTNMGISRLVQYIFTQHILDIIKENPYLPAGYLSKPSFRSYFQSNPSHQLLSKWACNGIT